MYLYRLIKPRNTRNHFSQVSLSLLPLSPAIFHAPGARNPRVSCRQSIKGKKGREALAPSPLCSRQPFLFSPLLQAPKHQVQDLKSLEKRLVQVPLRSGVDLRSFEARVRSPSTDLQERLQQDRSARSGSIYLLPYLEYLDLRSMN